MATAIQPTDIKFYESTGNLGGAITATEIVTATMNNMFRNITSAEAATGITLFGVLYVKQTSTYNGSATKVWIQSNTPSPATALTIGLGSAGVNSTEPSIGSDTTPPTGITFVTAIDEANSLTAPDLAAGDYIAIHVKYVVDPAAPAINLDNMVLRVKMDSPSL
jgi:hypothetical protein